MESIECNRREDDERSSTHLRRSNIKRNGYIYYEQHTIMCLTSVKVLMLLVQVRTRRWVNVCVSGYRSVTNYRTHSTYLYVPSEKNRVYQRMSDTTVVNHTAVVCVWYARSRGLYCTTQTDVRSERHATLLDVQGIRRVS